MLLPVLASAALILSAPFMGLLRTWLGDVFKGSFVTFMAGAIGTAVAVVAIVALVRIRTHRVVRFTAIGLAVAAALAYSRAMTTGWPEVDIVERVHFVEYGVITFLFYRAWRPAADISVIALPILAGIVVGTLEEWFQWFIPNRVGELRDIALNLVAVVCGLVVSIAIAPPPRLARSLSPGSRRRLAVASACVIASVAFFVDQIHLGHEIAAEGFRFRSHWTASELGALAADRAARWKTDPPLTWRRVSREDQYMDEGLWHVRRRQQHWDANNRAGAFQENRILETYFVPVLDTPSWAGPEGQRWPAALIDEARRGAASGESNATYTSDAQPYPIVLVPRWAWRIGALVAMASAMLARNYGARRFCAQNNL
jgi:hypothetical protein